MMTRGTATVTCATAGWLLVAACGGSQSPTSPSATHSSFPLANLDREAVIAALDYWRATTGVTYQIVTDDTLPRLLIRSGTDGLAPWGGGRSLIDGTFPENNRASSALVVFEPGGGSYCTGASASALKCRYLYRHELGHAFGIFENTGAGLMGSGTDTLSDREVRMLVALYSLPHGAAVQTDGTWRVAPDGPSGVLDDLQAAQDIVSWNMLATGGASYRRQDRICRWELPVRVYLAQ